MANVNDFQILRVKGPDSPADVDGNDPDWYGIQLHPNTGYWTVGGVAADGTYSLTFQRVGKPASEAVVISVTRVGGVPATNNDIAAALEAAVAAEIGGGTLDGYLVASSVSAATLALTSDQVAWYTITGSAPGTGTLTPLGAAGEATGTLWPITAAVPFNRRPEYGPNTDVELTLVALTSAGVVVDSDAATYTMEVVETIVVPQVPGTTFSPVNAVASRGEIAGTFGQVHGVQLNGSGQFGVRLHTITEAATTDRIVVMWRAVVA